jgi:hypothetical protein
MAFFIPDFAELQTFEDILSEFEKWAHDVCADESLPRPLRNQMIIKGADNARKAGRVLRDAMIKMIERQTATAIH